METINDGHADLEQALAMKERMTPSQRRAYDALMTALAGRSDAKVFFLYGSGGTGKTFLQNAVRAEMVSREVGSAVCVASTGIAATLLSGGLTAHRFFKIPLSCDETSYCNIKKGSVEAASIEALRLIFWDEAVMTDRRVFDTVDRSLRDLRGCDDPFGGAVVCFCGDFRQILPVVPRGSRADIVASNITNARFWRDGRVEVLRLTENMRLRQPDVDGPTGDRVSAFTQLLTHLGDGGCIGNDGRVTGLEYLLIRGPSSVDELSRFVYDDVATRSHDPSYFCDRAILTSRTHVVTDANARMLQQLPGSVFTAYSHDELRGDGGSANTNVPIETLHSFEDPSIPAHAIPLKRNCPVMVMRNVDTARRVCNGTRLQVIRFSRHTLYCRRLRPYGPSRPTTEADFVLLKRITFDAPGNAFLPLRRKQFPIRLCFAMTINKSQGQSFDRVGLMLDPPIFSHGQLYVALSRVTAPDGIRIASDEEAARTGRVSNIVWPEVFQSVRVSDVN